MSLSVIALIIVGVMCVLYIWGKWPVALVTALGMLAMIFTGCVSSSVAFSNFGSTPVLLVFGMVIIVDAILESGLLTQYEHLLEKMTRRSEKGFLVLTFLSAGIISMFTNNTALVAMFMPFITSVAKSSGGRIRRKHIYLPLAMGGLIGGTGSLAGSTAPLLEEEFTGDKLEKASELVVDMAGLEYLSSAGLRVLLFAKKTMDGKPMTLRNASDEIVEIFDMTGFTGFFTFE